MTEEILPEDIVQEIDETDDDDSLEVPNDFVTPDDAEVPEDDDDSEVVIVEEEVGE